jgi:hypothetical protein
MNRRLNRLGQLIGMLAIGLVASTTTSAATDDTQGPEPRHATALDSPNRHVRTTEPTILSLIDAGLSRSGTFRRLVTTLDESDVIVYIERKRTHQALGGYLAHNIVTEGNRRYLRIAVETQGAKRRLVSLLAHELQHAVEVAQTPDARDPKTLARMFSRLSIKFGCGDTTCYETQAAKDIEHTVREELAQK